MYVSSLDHNGKHVCTMYGNDVGYTDSEFDSALLDDDRVAERAVFYGVSLPGMTGWAREMSLGSSHTLAEALDHLHVDVSDVNRAPLIEDPSVTAVIKMYNLDEAERLKTTDVVDVVGILGMDGQPTSDWHLSEEEGAVQWMPSIHVLHWTRTPLESMAETWMQRQAATTHALSPSAPSPFADDVALRTALIDYLAAALGHDALAAEFVLLVLLGRIHARRAGVTVGSFSLNLSRMVEHDLVPALESLMPTVVRQPLNLTTLNDPKHTLFVRHAEQETHAGRLQLPNGTCVVIDERTMQEGKLHDHGVQNIRALTSVLQKRSLPYVLPYSEMHLDTDLIMVVVSEGKSFLPVDVHVPVQSMQASTMPSVSNETLQAWRAFLARTRSESLTIPETVSQHIQDDFVERRRVSSNFDQEDLQRCLSIARLLALSHGHTELTPELWRRAIALDEARAARLGTPP